MQTEIDRLLVTTALAETFDPIKEIVFLGPWCSHDYQNLKNLAESSTTIDYHWDNLSKFTKDDLKIHEIYQDSLNKISSILNEHHGTDFSLEYWQILIGPWLNTFITVLFDRWESITKAYESIDELKTIVLDLNEEKMIPYHFQHFKQTLSISDVWNHFIFSKIIEYQDRKFKLIKSNKDFNFRKNTESQRRSVLSFLGSFVRFIRDYIYTRNEDALFVNTMIASSTEKKFQKILGQRPVLRKPKIDPLVGSTPNMKIRKLLTKKFFKGQSEFERFLSTIIFIQFPSSYLEDYKKLVSSSINPTWPSKPKVVFTSRSHLDSDTFKHWVGKRKEELTLAVFQHGSNYGTDLVHDFERLELSIADKLLSWGWSEKKVKPFLNIRTLGVPKPSPDKEGSLLFIDLLTSQYFVTRDSLIRSPNIWKIYQRNASNFFGNIREPIQNSFSVRLSPGEQKWADQRSRWKKLSENISFAEGPPNKLIEHYNKSRLCVHGYQGTAFLELISFDFPSIVILDMDVEPLRKNVRKDFEELEKVKIVHFSAASAATHVNEVWDNIDSWWFDKKTVEAKKTFKEKFCRTRSDPADYFKKIVEELIKE